jgi:hypothetical protein
MHSGLPEPLPLGTPMLPPVTPIEEQLLPRG